VEVEDLRRLDPVVQANPIGPDEHQQVAQLQVLQEPKVRIAVARENGVARTAR
jgi:hypothetical protein